MVIVQEGNVTQGCSVMCLFLVNWEFEHILVSELRIQHRIQVDLCVFVEVFYIEH